MNEPMSPYQPPQPEMQSEQVMPATRSGVPKVFGVLHLVFGGLGLVMGLFSIVMVVFREQFEKMQFATYPEEVREGMRESMEPLYATQSWDMVSSAGSLILSVFLLIAGFNLVKYRRKGLKVSNIYSVLSIVHKLFAVVVMILIKVPAMKKVGESLDEISGGASSSMGTVIGPIAVIMGIVMVVVMMIYPVLCYVMLNKKQAKDSLV